MNPLQQKLDINNERYRIIVSIKEDYLVVRLMNLLMQSKV